MKYLALAVLWVFALAVVAVAAWWTLAFTFAWITCAHDVLFHFLGIITAGSWVLAFFFVREAVRVSKRNTTS